jgi:hypothetical protein
MTRLCAFFSFLSRQLTASDRCTSETCKKAREDSDEELWRLRGVVDRLKAEREARERFDRSRRDAVQAALNTLARNVERREQLLSRAPHSIANDGGGG